MIANLNSAHAPAVKFQIICILNYIPGGGGGYFHTFPIMVSAAQRGGDFEAPDLERGIHFRGVL